MAGINYWEAAGMPTQYLAPNFMPTDSSFKADIPVGLTYVVTAKARSVNGNAVLRYTSFEDGVNEGVLETPLTKEWKTITNTWTETKTGRLFIKDRDAKGDIEIKDIQVNEVGFEVATINGVDGFGTAKPGMTGKIGLTADLTGKVYQSPTVPHMAYSRTSNTFPTFPLVLGTNVLEFSQVGLDRIMALGGTTAQGTTSPNGFMAQHMFSFDVVKELEKHITVGAIPYANKVQWAKDNIKALSFSWWGKGAGPLGNKATLRHFAIPNASWDYDMVSHTSAAVSKLTITLWKTSLVTPTINADWAINIRNNIDDNGFVHFLVHSEPSNGTIASTIDTDYVQLAIRMEQSTVVDSKWTYHSGVKVIDNETIEITSESAFQTGNELFVPVEPNTEYYLNHDLVTDLGCILTPFQADGTGTGTGNILGGAFVRNAFTTPSNAVSLKIVPMSRIAGTFAVKNLTLNKGNTPIKHERKRGERMVIPTVGKNLSKENKVTLIAPTTADVLHDEKVETEVGKYYTLSITAPPGVVVQARIGSTASIYNAANIYGDGTRQKMTFKATDPILTLRKYVTNRIGTFVINDIQVEEGADATTFRPFRYQVSEKVSGVSRKNLLPPIGQWENNSSTKGKINSNYNLEISNDGMGSHFKYYVPVKPGVDYSMSFEGTGYGYYYFTNGAKTRITSTAQGKSRAPSDAAFAEVILNSNIGTTLWTFKNFQFEEGEITPFEPFRESSRKINGVPKKNLIKPFGSAAFDYASRTNGWTIASSITYKARPDGYGFDFETSVQWANIGYNHFIEPDAIGKVATFSAVMGGGSNSSVVLRFMNDSAQISQVITGSGGGGLKKASAVIPPGTTRIVAFSELGVTNQKYTANDWLLEIGNSAVFEPYQELSRRARQGLQFDGRSMVASSNPISLGERADITVVFKSDNPIGKTMALIDQYAYGFAILVNAAGGLGVRFGADTATTNYLSRETAGVNYLDDKVHVARLKVEANYFWFYVDGVVLLEGAPQTQGKTFSALNMNAKYSIGARTDNTGALKDLAYIGDILYASISDGNQIISEFDFSNPRSVQLTKAKAKKGPDGLIVGNPRQLNSLAFR